MGQPWAAGSADGAPARLPLVLTALWAAAVGLELAYVLVLGPGPPPLGPLARALQLALAAFQLLNLLGNVGLFLRSDPSIRGVMLAGRGLGQGWAYCYQCQSQVPPRSGHCSACRVCILRRDHHCRLLGRCVGFGNYRPFLCLLLHAAGVLLHISVLLGPALSALLRAHTPLHMAALLLLPWLMLLTGGEPGRPLHRGRGPGIGLGSTAHSGGRQAFWPGGPSPSVSDGQKGQLGIHPAGSSTETGALRQVQWSGQGIGRFRELLRKEKDSWESLRGGMWKRILGAFLNERSSRNKGLEGGQGIVRIKARLVGRPGGRGPENWWEASGSGPLGLSESSSAHTSFPTGPPLPSSMIPPSMSPSPPAALPYLLVVNTHSPQSRKTLAPVIDSLSALGPVEIKGVWKFA
ncbi:putative palmitoyltransferase ZDHHC24 isoform X2 [Macaca mulatta]